MCCYYNLCARQRSDVEGILIAAMPTTANGANPKFAHLRLPAKARERLRRQDWIMPANGRASEL